MSELWRRFWKDESGSIPATEWMIVASILTLAVLVATLSMHHEEANDDYAPPAMIR